MSFVTSLTEDTSVKNSLTSSSLLLFIHTGMIADNHIKENIESKMSKILAVIPARFSSTRLPGKPLAEILGKPMIQHVWECVSSVVPTVVATDDFRIYDKVQSFGGMVQMTSANCLNGTARVAEVISNLVSPLPEIVLNIQGDEPLVKVDDLETLINLMMRPEVNIGTLVTSTKFIDKGSLNICYVDRLNNGRCLSFSRVPNNQNKQWRHVGMYGFKTETLLEIITLNPTEGELKERLEQLRWHESGFEIYSSEVSTVGPGVDSYEDLILIRKVFNEMRPK